MKVQMGKMRIENIKRSCKKKIDVNGVCKKHRLRAAAEHTACLVILSLVVALVIVGPGAGEMEERKKKHDRASY